MGIARNLRRLARKQDAVAAKKPQRKAMMEPLEPRVLLSADGVIGGITGALDTGFGFVYNEMDDLIANDPLLDAYVPGILITQIMEDSAALISPTMEQALGIEVDVDKSANPYQDSGFGSGIEGTNSLAARYSFVANYADDYSWYGDSHTDERALDAMDINRDGRVSAEEAFGVLVFGQIENYLGRTTFGDWDGSGETDSEDVRKQTFAYLTTGYWSGLSWEQLSIPSTSGMLENLDISDRFELSVDTAGSSSSGAYGDVMFDLDITLVLKEADQVDLGYRADELDIFLDPGDPPVSATPTKVNVWRTLEFDSFIFGFNNASDEVVDDFDDFYFGAPEGMRLAVDIDSSTAADSGDPVSVAGMEVNVGFLGTTVQNVTGEGYYLDMDALGYADDPSHPEALGFTRDSLPQSSGTGSITAAAAPESVTQDADTANDYQLEWDVVFSLKIGNQDYSPAVEVKLYKGATTDNDSLSDLITDIESAITFANGDLGDLVTVKDNGGKIQFVLHDGVTVNPTPLGFAAETTGGGAGILLSSTTIPLVGQTAPATVRFLLYVGGPTPQFKVISFTPITVDHDGSETDGDDTTNTVRIVTLGSLIADLNTALGGTGVVATENAGKIQLTSTGGVPLGITNTISLDTVEEITLRELADNDQVFQIAADPDASFTLNLTLKADAGLQATGTDTPYEPQGTISVNLNPFDQGVVPTNDVEGVLVDVDPDTGIPIYKAKYELTFGGDMDPEMLDFNVIGTPEVLGIINQLGNWLDRLVATDLFTTFDIPFAETSLAELLAFKDLISDTLLIDDGDDGTKDPAESTDDVNDQMRLLGWADINGQVQLVPFFGNAQELEERLAKVLVWIGVYTSETDALAGIDASYDSTAKELTYNLDLTHNLIPYSLQADGIEAPLDFNLNLDPLASIVTDGKVSLTATGSFDFTLGIKLGNAAAALTGSSTLEDDLNAGEGVTLNTNLALTSLDEIVPIVGRLSANASFILSVWRDGERTDAAIALTKAETIANNSFDDLVAQLNEKLAGTGVVADDSMAGTGEGDSGRIVLRAADADIDYFQVWASSGNTAYSELGLQPQSAATVSLIAPAAMAWPTPGTNVSFDISIKWDGGFSTTVGTVNVLSIADSGNLSNTTDNSTFNDLINDINEALKAIGLDDDIVASQSNGYLVLSAINANITGFTVTPTFTAAEKLGLDLLKYKEALKADGVDATAADALTSLAAGVTLRGQDVPANPFGRLTGGVAFTLNGVSLSLAKADTDANATVDDLIRDINTAINGTSLKGTIVAEGDAYHIVFRAIDPTIGQIAISDLSVGEAAQLGIQNGDSGGSSATGPDLTVVANRLAPLSYGVNTDATFTVSVTDSTKGQLDWSVTIDDANTITNRSLYDLAADINTAMNAGFVDTYPAYSASENPLIATVQGKQIVIGLKTTEGGANLIGDLAPVSQDVTAFSISVADGDGNSAATQLRLTSDSDGAQTNIADTADFVVFYADGNSERISLDSLAYGQKLSDAKTIADLIALLETSGNLDVSLRSDGSGLVLQDKTFDTSTPGNNVQSFRIVGVNGSPAALQLGILGSDTSQLDVGQYDAAKAGSPDGKIEGARIATIDLLDRVFIESPHLTATVDLSTVGAVSAEANFGFVGVKLESGVDQTLFNAAATVPFILTDGRVMLSDLFSSLGNIGSLRDFVGLPTLVTSSDFDLKISVFPDTLADIFEIPDTATVHFDIQNLGILQDVYSEGEIADVKQLVPWVHVEGVGIDALANFQDINFDNVIAALQKISEFLQEFDALSFLGQDIPLLGVSIDDLLEVADKFAQAVEDIQQNPAGGLQVLAQKICEAFGLPDFGDLSVQANLDAFNAYFSERGIPNPTELIKFALGNLDGTNDLLRFDLRLPIGFSKGMNLDLDLGALDFLDQLGLPVDLQGAAGLNLTGYLDARLSFGIDLDNPTNIYLFDDASGIVGSLTAGADNIAFNAAIGPMGIFIKDGNIQLDVDFGLNDTGSDPSSKVLLDVANLDDLFDGTSADFEAYLEGTVTATLPVFFPDDSEFIGDIVLDISGANKLALDTSGNIQIPDFTDPDILTVPDFSMIDLSKIDPFGGIPQMLDTLDFFLQGLQDILDGEVFGISLPLIGNQLQSGADFIEDLRRDILTPLRQYAEQAPDIGLDLVQGLLYSLLGPGSDGVSITGIGDLSEFLGLDSDFSGLGLLIDYETGLGEVTIDDVVAAYSDGDDDGTDPDDFLWKFRLGDTYTPSVDIGFDIGFPALGLAMNTGLDVSVAWDLAIGLGVSTAEGAYMYIGNHRTGETTDDAELLLELNVDIPDSSATDIEGRLGFLQLLVNESHTLDDALEFEDRGTYFAATFSVNLIENGATGTDAEKITFSELGSLDVALFGSAEAEVNLDIVAQFNEDILPDAITALIPKLEARFILDWETGNVFAEDFDFASSLDILGFRDVQIDMGSFLTEFLGPIVDKVYEITAPLQPVIEVFTTPIPLISDIAGQPITLLDIAALFGEVDPSMIYAIADIITLVNKIGAISDDAELAVPLGDFILVGGPAGTDLADDLMSPNFNLSGSADDGGFDVAGFLASTGQAVTDFAGKLGSSSGDADAKALSQSLVNGTAPGSGDFIFPLFDNPSLAFQLLLGKDVALVEYDLPPFGVDFTYVQKFPIWGPLFARITGSIGLTIDLAFGYDTFGVREFAGGDFTNPLDLLAGFYVNDTDQPGGTGTDVPELILKGELFAGAEINLGIASAGVEGGIILTVNFDLYDPDSDGKVRVDELLGSFLYEFNYGSPALAPIAIFDVYGDVALQLRAFIEFLMFKQTFEITPPITLVEFSIEFDREPFLATERGDGALVLNIGSGAANRENGDTRDIGEEIWVKSISASEVLVWSGQFNVGESAAQKYDIGANKLIIVDGGDGNDIIHLEGVGHGIAVEVNGSAGDDQIWGGQSGGILKGDLGNDKIYGGDGHDVIYGGEGNDYIEGGKSVDWIFGDNGIISIINDADGNGTADDPTTRFRSLVGDKDGDDTIYGGDENSPGDIIFGGGGLDMISGGAGDDLIFGDGGYFDFDPDTGAIPMAGGFVDLSKMTARGTGAKDTIYGNAGNDAILGGAGDDLIDGGEDNDIVSGGFGFDAIYGGSGADYLFGDENDDTIFGYRDPAGATFGFAGETADNATDGNDYVEGGEGNDFIRGQAGVDTLHGNRGSDIIFGDAGNDIIGAGQLGRPWLAADDQPNDEEAGGDIIFGGANDDIIDAGAGSDIVFGDEGLVAYLDFHSTAITPFTTLGSRIRTDAAGVHKLIGDGDETTLIDDYGDSDDGNALTPDLYVTKPVATDGSDTIIGGDGNDVVFGGGGLLDIIFGDFDPAVELNGPRPVGQDVLIGDGGRVELYGRRYSAAEAVSNSLDGKDKISGNDYGDYIFGGGHEDTIWGFEDPAVGSNSPLMDESGAVIPENDVILGDNGRIEFDASESKNRIERIFTTHVTGDSGKSDTIYGQFGDDVILGGLNSSQDVLVGGLGNDVILGDQGELEFDDDGDLDTLDWISSYPDNIGGGDKISGMQGNDVLIGGTGGDEMYGDDDSASSGADDGEDIMLGDNADIFLIGTEGRLLVQVAAMPAGTAVDLITTTDILETTGGTDIMSGNAQSDIMLGGVYGDFMYGDREYADGVTPDGFDLDDIMLGDNGLLDFTHEDDTDRNTLDLIHSEPYAVTNWTTVPPTLDKTIILGGEDIISGNAGKDVAIGGAAGDTIYGDDEFATATTGDKADLLLGDNADIFLVAAPTVAVGEEGDLKMVLDAAVKTIRTTDYDYPDKDTGGSDTISGNAMGDIIAGGIHGDTLYGDRATPTTATTGLDGDDIILGDNGAFEWLSEGRLDEVLGIYIEANNPDLYDWFTNLYPDGDEDLSTLDLVTTEQPNNGGRDLIYGDEGRDLVFGGTDADTIYGDDGTLDEIADSANNDLIFGDHGRIYPQFSTLRAEGQDWRDAFNSRNFFAIDTGDADGGEGDRMWGEEGDDTMLGQQGDDRMWGGSGDDDMTGGHNVSGGIDELTDPNTDIEASLNPAITVPSISDVNDLMDGGTGDDSMAGDNAIIWRRGDDLSPRFRELTEDAIYTTTGSAITANIGGDWQSDPADAIGRDIELVDHADTTAAGLFGADVMAGGADNDVMFGQLANDLMQGDGYIGANDNDTGTITYAIKVEDDVDPDETLYFNIPEAETDADDYMEGNGGSDLMYGGLGQDDIIGGSSELFGLVTEAMRPDSSDFIFGGAGIDTLRNTIGATSFGLAVEDTETNVITTSTDGHSRDADFIMGDNANVYRLVNSSDEFLNFNYDDAYGLQIIPRAMEQLDYTLGGADYAGGTYANGAANDDNGAADLIHGESGDDVIFGMTGSDVIFGEGQDDDIVGGYGNDWISGGTGQDGVLGDDGLILTSRNSTLGEPLYGIEGLLAKDPQPKYADGDVLNEIIYTPGSIQYAVINVEGQLKKSIDLVPFSYDPDWIAIDDEFPDNQDNQPYADDIIFGGLGSDWLHGGSGDDAISGAEALAKAYVPDYNDADKDMNTAELIELGYDMASDPANLLSMNPGDALAFNPMDVDGQHLNNRYRAGEFPLYDEYDPRRIILLTPSGELYKGSTDPLEATEGVDYFQFLLNFDETEGVVRPAGEMPKATGQQTEYYPEVNDDGGDAIFGDLGNDWLVGGTGADDLYGGWGNDLLNADDDHTTLGEDGVTVGANDLPDTHPFYQDRAYGGAGRDILIGNTGGDRLIDWVGEYNSYLVPYAPFGQASVSRTLQPFLPEFLYALSAGDGADFTRPGDTGASEPRNGEPDAEMGLVLQKDFAWQDQTGAPADPQAGNIPGGARDVLRSAGFNDGTSDAFFVDSGVWTVVSGRYEVAPESLGGDALSVFYVDEYIPSYFEMLATISAVKPTGGYNANSYLVFDYQSSEDFKFAGINVSTSKLEIGYHDASGWHVAVQAPYTGSMKADTDYNVFLSLNGSTAILRVDNKVTLTYTFAARVDEYGIQHFLNEGMVGLGAKNAKAQIDNVVVQRIAPQTTFQKTVNFSSQADVDSLFQGNLTIADGVHALTATAGDTAIDLVDLRIAPASVLALETIFNTANQGGFVFDYYGPEDFKFVALSVETGKVLVGHSTSRAGVAVDAEWSATLSADTDYKLGITIAERSVSVTLDGRAVSSYSFNALATDGEFGLLARNGEVVFDSFMIMTDDPALAGITPVLPTVSILDASILEGNDGSQAVSLTLTLSAASTEVVTVDYATADDTAVAGEDYEHAAGTVTFEAGETTRDITFQVYGDILFELDETFDVVLSNASNAVIFDGTGTIAILNDDEDSAPALSVSNVSIQEGDDGFTSEVTVTVTLSAASTEEVTVDYATVDGTAVAGEDYEHAAGTVTFAADETTRDITFQVYGDTLFEVDETFGIELSDAVGAAIAEGLGTVTILNDDVDPEPPALPTIFVSNAPVFEGDEGTADVSLTFTLSAASTEEVTVDYATADGAATVENGDYLSATGTVTFVAGEISKDVTFQIYSDTLFEPDETFDVALSNAVGATIADGTGVITILNDDMEPPPTLPSLSISDASVAEGDKANKTKVTVTVTLSEASEETVTVQLATEDGTAESPSDYVSAAATITFNSDETQKTYTLTVNGDKVGEYDEWFGVRLSNAVGAAIADDLGEVTILNDDGSPLTAAAAAIEAGTVEALSGEMLAPIVDTAISRWAEALVLNDKMLSTLYAVDFQIVDFAGLTLGLADQSTIFIDADAAGWGWFVDPTPADDVEFAGTGAAPAGMDLLTVVMHEMGHTLGYDDAASDSNNLMSATLNAGERPALDSQSLVVMDTSNLDDEEAPDPAARAMEKHSWLREFLITRAQSERNPFEPTENIQIMITDEEAEEA